MCNKYTHTERGANNEDEKEDDEDEASSGSKERGGGEAEAEADHISQWRQQTFCCCCFLFICFAFAVLENYVSGKFGVFSIYSSLPTLLLFCLWLKYTTRRDRWREKERDRRSAAKNFTFTCTSIALLAAMNEASQWSGERGEAAGSGQRERLAGTAIWLPAGVAFHQSRAARLSVSLSLGWESAPTRVLYAR